LPSARRIGHRIHELEIETVTEITRVRTGEAAPADARPAS